MSGEKNMVGNTEIKKPVGVCDFVGVQIFHLLNLESATCTDITKLQGSNS